MQSEQATIIANYCQDKYQEIITLSKQQLYDKLAEQQWRNLNCSAQFLKIQLKDTLTSQRKQFEDILYLVEVQSIRQCLTIKTIILIILGHHPQIKPQQLNIQSIQVDIMSLICKDPKNCFIIPGRQLRAIQFSTKTTASENKYVIMKEITNAFQYGLYLSNFFSEMQHYNNQRNDILLYCPFSGCRVRNPVIHKNCIRNHFGYLYFADYQEIYKLKKQQKELQLLCPYPKCGSNYACWQELIFEEQYRKVITEDLYKDQIFMNIISPFKNKLQSQSERQRAYRTLNYQQFKIYSKIIKYKSVKTSGIHPQIVLRNNVKIPSRCKHCTLQKYDDLYQLIGQTQMLQMCSLCNHKIQQLDEEIFIDITLALILHFKLTKQQVQNSFFSTNLII